MFFLRKRADPLKVFLNMGRGNGVGFCMGPRFVNIDHDTPLLLPPNLRDWVPSDPMSLNFQKSGGRILNSSRPTPRKPSNQGIATVRTPQNDILSPTASPKTHFGSL